MDTKVNPAVYELLEIAKISSPFSANLINLKRRKIVDRLLATKKIDPQTADYLLE